MLSPKKGLLCNLNHIHLQHVSLGLHLSRHPELREGSVTMAPREQTGCSDCQENHGALEQVEQVDANSNNPSLQCRCCESHVPQPLKSGLRNQPALGDFLSLPMEENLASPSDAASSSSVSSCSDFSLDDTPVSVYCKEFPSDETQSPDLQPNIIPIEDARDAAPPTEQGTIMPEGRDSRLSPPEWEHLEALAQGSPDSLCSSSSLNSLSDTTSASVDMPETPGERPLPAVGGELDSNCNALPAMGSSPPGTCALAPGQLDLNLNRAPQPTPGPASGPPPVPPRPKRGLQILLSKMAMEKPAPAEAPAEPMGSLGEPPRDPARKNITSFHELAQKRKRNMAGPPLAQAKKDRSDWLIVFSPDTELPPPSELIACSAQGQELPRPQPQPGKQANPPSSSQREVTTFKELRYRNAINKQRGQLAWGEGAALQELPEPQQAAVGRALPSGEGLQGPSWAPALPLGSHSVAPAESYPPQRKKSRPGLQPIAEGLPGDAEDRGLPSGGCAPRRKQFWSDCEEEASGWRPRGPDGNPQELGRAERGDRTCKEGKSSGGCRHGEEALSLGGQRGAPLPGTQRAGLGAGVSWGWGASEISRDPLPHHEVDLRVSSPWPWPCCLVHPISVDSPPSATSALTAAPAAPLGPVAGELQGQVLLGAGGGRVSSVHGGVLVIVRGARAGRAGQSSNKCMLRPCAELPRFLLCGTGDVCAPGLLCTRQRAVCKNGSPALALLVPSCSWHAVPALALPPPSALLPLATLRQRLSARSWARAWSQADCGGRGRSEPGCRWAPRSQVSAEPAAGGISLRPDFGRCLAVMP